jgi:hypothetical protein
MQGHLEISQGMHHGAVQIKNERFYLRQIMGMGRHVQPSATRI